MKSKSIPVALRKKAIAAIFLIGILTACYIIFMSGSSEVATSTKRARGEVDTGNCEVTAITMNELKTHNKCSLRDPDNNDFWITISGYVFDVSDWIERHPGGESICSAEGVDATSMFKKIHGDSDLLFKELLKPKYCIGKFTDH